MKSHLIALFFMNTFINSYAVEPVKLSEFATIIGTEETFDYTTSSCTKTVNTIANAFDGNPESIFATCDRSGGWVGLDLGEKHVITKIAYCPRKDEPQPRMLLGLFEGANNPDFGDAIPLFLISEAPQKGVMTEQLINCSKGFRYVRYIGPNDVKCNLAELEFYGYKGEGDDSQLYQVTNLPTITIHTKNAEDIVEKEKYLKGIVSVISENGTKIYTDSLEVRGRGNASWEFPKKPYRMKLYNKVSLLELPAVEKNWTLINNYGDKTLMRNLLAFNLSKKLEMTYTPAGKAVDVILNGEYKGTYQLCDQIEVATGRVELEKMKANDIELPNLSGGYLIEIDAYADQEPEQSWFSSNPKGIPVTIKYPKDDNIVPKQKAYIKSHFETMLNTLYGSNYKNTENGYRKYIDTQTFIRHFLVGELSGNTDTYWSVYSYKKRNTDKFYFGPVWDFDIAYENDYRTYPINNLNDWLYKTKGSYANGMRDFVNRLFSDQNFLNEVKSTYASYRDNKIITEESLLQVVDNYATELDQSQKLNFTRWDILNSQVHMNPRTYGSYAGEVQNVRNYITNRLKWIDKKLNYTPGSGIEEFESKYSDVSVFNEENTLHIKGIKAISNIEIYNLAGLKIYSDKISEDIEIKLDKGVYIIELSSPSFRKVFKNIIF